MSNENQKLPGPAALLVTAYSVDTKEALLSLLEDVGVEDAAVIFCTRSMVSGTVEEALSSVSTEEPAPADSLPPVILFSGISLQQVQYVVKDFHQSGLPRPIFATTTEHNMNFSVKELVLHLLEERKEQQEQSKRNSQI